LLSLPDRPIGAGSLGAYLLLRNDVCKRRLYNSSVITTTFQQINTFHTSYMCYLEAFRDNCKCNYISEYCYSVFYLELATWKYMLLIGLALSSLALLQYYFLFLLLRMFNANRDSSSVLGAGGGHCERASNFGSFTRNFIACFLSLPLCLCTANLRKGDPRPGIPLCVIAAAPGSPQSCSKLLMWCYFYCQLS
jgi:hypothetical protein